MCNEKAYAMSSRKAALPYYKSHEVKPIQFLPSPRFRSQSHEVHYELDVHYFFDFEISIFPFSLGNIENV